MRTCNTRIQHCVAPCAECALSFPRRLAASFLDLSLTRGALQELLTQHSEDSATRWRKNVAQTTTREYVRVRGSRALRHDGLREQKGSPCQRGSRVYALHVLPSRRR